MSSEKIEGSIELGKDFTYHAQDPPGLVHDSSDAGLEVKISKAIEKTIEKPKDGPIEAVTLSSDFGLSDDDLLTLLNTLKNPKPRKKRRIKLTNRASVTEFSQISWCELQHYYERIFGRPQPTEIMLNGITRHYELELEVHTLVKVKTKTLLDSWGLKLYDALTRINKFKRKGIAREVRVFGFLSLKGQQSKVLTMGIIDLIQRKESEPGHSVAETINLIDNKTRLGNSLPSEKQSKNQKLQMMLYKKMFDELISCGKKAAVSLKVLPATFENLQSSLSETDFSINDFFSTLRIDHNEGFSDVFLGQLVELKAHKLIRKSSTNEAPFTILDIFKALLLSLSSLPYCSSELTLKYEHQKSRAAIGEVNFEHDPTSLDEHIQKSLEYLLNVRQPTGVTDIEEAGYKCGNCNFAENCDWRKEKAKFYSKTK